MGTFFIFRRLFTLYRQLNKQESYLKRYLPVLLNEVAPGHKQAFSPAHFKRTTKYWQLALNLICDNLYQLSGKKLSENEQKRIILLSVFGPLFDDLFDDKILDHEKIASLVEKPDTYVANNETDCLVAQLYLELLRSTPHRSLFTKHLKDLFYWQNASLNQLNESISEEELYQVTYKKSYYAVLLYCAALDHYPNPELVSLLYPVSGLMQLTNDAFDVWKDVHNGLYTLPNLYRNFERLQQHFMVEIAQINQTLLQLPYQSKAKQKFAITIHSLHAMGWMALEQLQEVTTGITSLEELRRLSRQTLVCDLDSLPQQLRWIRHIRRLSIHQEATV